MSSDTYNIAIIGQTGVGKSALINYLFGKNAPTGVGKPVTSEGFHEYDCQINGFNRDKIDVKVYDSWGLEVGKHAEWTQMFRKELESRGIDKAPREWFHSIIYCVSGSSHRVQSADLDIINEVLNNEYPITIAITKADSLSEEDEEKIISIIKQHFYNQTKNLTISPVCSVKKKVRSGEIDSFGKEEIERSIRQQILSAITLRLPHCLEKKLHSIVGDWKKSCTQVVNQTGSFNEKEMIKKIEEKTKKTKETLEIERSELTNSVLQSYEKSLTSHQGQDENKASLDSSFTDMAWWEKITVGIIFPFAFVPTLAYLALTEKEKNKRSLINMIEETEERFILSIKEDREKIERQLKSFQKETASTS